MSALDEMFSYYRSIAAYVDRQTNPWTGAPLPQPTVGQGSAENPAVPPPPGEANRGGG